MKAIDVIENELLHHLSSYHNQQDLLRYLIGEGKAAPCLPAEERNEADLVPGCVSKIWLRSRLVEGCVYFDLDGQSFMVKGLASLLLKLFHGQSPQAILAHQVRLFDCPPLATMLPRSKRNGLSQLIERIYAQAQAYPT